MFLPTTTIENIQKLFAVDSLCLEKVVITSIDSARGVAHIRYTMDGRDAVSIVHPRVGDKLHILLDDTVRWQAYYLVEEIANGREKDEGVTSIMALWPELFTNVTVAAPVVERDGNIVDFKTPTPKPETLVRPEKLNALQEKFGTRAVTRSHRK